MSIRSEATVEHTIITDIDSVLFHMGLDELGIGPTAECLKFKWNALSIGINFNCSYSSKSTGCHYHSRKQGLQVIFS